jgi:acyl carrier protein
MGEGQGWGIQTWKGQVAGSKPTKYVTIKIHSIINLLKTGEHPMEDMKEVIKEYIIKEYVEDDSEVNYDTPLISGGIVDSFSMVSLKRFLENKYKISIPDDKATPEAFDSVNKIVMLVREFTNA